MRTWLRRFLPEPVPTTYGERLRASAGAFIGIGAVAAVSKAWVGSTGDLPLLVAPLGASAILLFSLPASPLAQPWSIIGGNMIAALVGVTAAHWIASPMLAAAVAVSLTFAGMSLLRCIHPPSGAVALTAVLGGPHILAAGYAFAFHPIGLSSVILTALALLYNNATGRSYPHASHAPVHPHPASVSLNLTADDVREALGDYGEALDISPADLEVLFKELVGRAERNGLQTLGRGRRADR